MQKAIRRGDLFYADLNPVVGSEQGGIRPVLVIQNDVGNHFSPTVVAAAITSRKAKNSLPICAGDYHPAEGLGRAVFSRQQTMGKDRSHRGEPRRMGDGSELLSGGEQPQRAG